MHPWIILIYKRATFNDFVNDLFLKSGDQRNLILQNEKQFTQHKYKGALYKLKEITKRITVMKM